MLHSKSTFAKRFREKGAGIRGRWYAGSISIFILPTTTLATHGIFLMSPGLKNLTRGLWAGIRDFVTAYMQGFNVGYLGTPAPGAQQMTRSVTLPAPLADEWQDGYRQGCGLAQWEEAWAIPD